MKKCVVVLAVLALLLLAACNQRDFDIYDAAFTAQQVVLAEGEDSIGAGFGLNKTMDVTQHGGAAYAFEPGISMDDRESCIQATEAVLSRLDTGKTLQINIYTTASYDATFVKNGAVFTHVQDWMSQEYIAALLQGLFGEYCNYGAAYGYAGYLAQALFDRTQSVLSGSWGYDGDSNALDMNALCFDTGYLGIKDIKSVRRLANTFAADYIGKNGEEAFQTLLAKSGDLRGVDAFTQALSDFYAANHITYTPSGILFRLGGKGYAYIVKCEYAVMYVEADWADRNEGKCPQLYEGFLRKNYSDVRQYFATIIEEMGKYQALLGLEDYDNDLNIYYTNHHGKGAVSYIPASHSITIQTVSSLSTIYMSAHLHGSGWLQEGWATTGFLQHFCTRYNEYGNALWSYMTNVTNRDNNYSTAYRDCLGRDVDFATDAGVMCHIDAVIIGKTDPNSDYTSGGSFVAYLVSRLGEEEVVDIVIRSHDFGEYTYEQLAADWQAYLQENYSQYR